MKQINKLQNIIIVLLFAILANFFFSSPIDTTYASTNPQPALNYYYNQILELPDPYLTNEKRQTIKSVYDVILNSYNSGNLKKLNEISVNWPYNYDEQLMIAVVSTAQFALQYDNPELSLFKFSYNLNIFPLLYSKLLIKPRFCDGISNISDFESKINLLRQQRNIIVNRANLEKTIYEKVSYVNEWLVRNTEYNSYVSQTGDSSTNSNTLFCHNVYSALITNDNYFPVCDGYSYAFKYIMDSLKIPSIIVEGISVNLNSSKPFGLHAWNQVYLYDKWYGIDVTWNDPTSTSSKSEYFITNNMNNYFLLNNSNFYTSYSNRSNSNSNKKRIALNQFFGNFDHSTGEIDDLKSWYYINPSLSSANFNPIYDVIDKQCVLSFNQQEGDGNQAQITLTKNSTLPILTVTPTREGYTFLGYFSEHSGGTKYYNADLTPTMNIWNKTIDMELYAQWEKIATNVDEEYEFDYYEYFENDDTYVIGISIIGIAIVIGIPVLIFMLIKKRNY